MLKYSIAFLLGVYVGQQYGTALPNLKKKSEEIYENFKKSDFYKKVNDDINKKK